MTNQEALKIIKNFCDANEITFDSSVTAAFGLSISALGAIEQYKWERDIAVAQLKELGLELGQKIDHVKRLIEKNTEKEAVDKSKNPTKWHVMHCPTCDRVFWNSGQSIHYEPKYCEKCGQKMMWKKNNE